VDFQDDTAFLFSLNNKTKHVPYGLKKDKAVRHTTKDFLIVLGQAPDIAIKQHCDKSKDSVSCYGNIGHSYEMNDHMSPNVANAYFTGAKNF
jgi:hypothetical protein